ncbi:nitroreductase family deazaflavin-dependent oxidoreductase [Aquihabitans sp. G128]|uniref:nitroreductase/quinone reductase family protein n=1 Tax=Aquihabitans sp. G128 TaxID=2849779 RepID=UPI001C214818|nr:nitroreductase/quinone reductase family protein [Aquihabitans sp. G128]QXC61264.1 nitroreductase family deazaflavin-dependent oxidoreductase [Aquihabitans sp. G128]QXC61315.1 nitroreductase family deazaflavin-dependent oxidoreductase [Aquihabitans sp. G128]
MTSDRTFKVMNAVHRVVLRGSAGRIGWEFDHLPVVRLTTTGRKSGRPRTVLLTSPIQEGDATVVVASKVGEDTHPAWFLNLRDQPAVRVARRGRPAEPMTARIAGAEERERLWPRITEAYPNYAHCQARTERVIPVVLLEPAT